MNSWKAYRQQFRNQHSSQHLVRPLNSSHSRMSHYSTLHRSQSPILNLKGEFEGFYMKATGSRPGSPKAFVNNVAFEPLILRTNAETKVAAEKGGRTHPICQLPDTLGLDDITKATDLLSRASEADCSKLSRQYIAELQRLSQVISQKFSG